MDDRRLALAVRNTPPRSLILLEDLDAAFPDRTKQRKADKEKESPYSHGYGLTLSGLLNALDGLTAGEGCMVFFTTNHIEVRARGGVGERL